MAEPDAAAVDTHPLLFHAAGGRRLSPTAARLFERCERRQAILYVPAAVIWECGLLARVGKVDLRRSLRAFFEDLFSNPAFQPVELTPGQVFRADEWRLNQDPFDGLIVAAAQTVGVPLITRDVVIQSSGTVPVIW